MVIFGAQTKSINHEGHKGNHSKDAK
jgi:hypothetical protein